MIRRHKTQGKDYRISKLIGRLAQSLLGYERTMDLQMQIYRKQSNLVKFIKEHRTIKVLHLFRNYSALIVVLSSALLVSATNLTAGQASSGFLFGYFEDAEEEAQNPLKDKFFIKSAQNSNLALAPLAEAKMAIDPVSIDLEKDLSEFAPLQGQALVAGTSMARKDPEEDGGVIIYTVRSGDTISSIAANHKVTINTILWANNIDNVDSIMPEDKIFILPVSGLSYTIKDGDTLDRIATTYKAEKDKIIAFNDLPADGEISKGQEIIIPDGEKEMPANRTLRLPTRTYESFDSTGKILSGKAGAGHKFPYGYCTWYVAQKLYVPWGGNAGTWLYHAKAAGYATGRAPRVGSIMVSSESYWGHVGIVESVKGDTFTISEMNYKAWGKKDLRTISKSDRVIKGFIYTEG